MKRSLIVMVVLISGVVAGSALGPRVISAQQSHDVNVAITTDAGGTWVVRGDKLMLCRRKVIQSVTNQPPEIECGRPIQLP